MMRIGHGMDVHRLVEGRKLILCGVEVPHTLGLLGHSDADVATHALMDALLGAAALGYRGADSIGLLREVCALLRREGYALGNADVTIVAQRPKLRPYIDAMRARLAQAMGVEDGRVSVKATTTEHLGVEGEELGISAHAVCLLETLSPEPR